MIFRHRIQTATNSVHIFDNNSLIALDMFRLYSGGNRILDGNRRSVAKEKPNEHIHKHNNNKKDSPTNTAFTTRTQTHGHKIERNYTQIELKLTRDRNQQSNRARTQANTKSFTNTQMLTKRLRQITILRRHFEQFFYRNSRSK